MKYGSLRPQSHEPHGKTKVKKRGRIRGIISFKKSIPTVPTSTNPISGKDRKRDLYVELLAFGGGGIAAKPDLWEVQSSIRHTW